MLANADRQEAEDIEKAILTLQTAPYAVRMVIEGAWGAAFHWIAFGCETKYQRHQESHARLGAFLRPSDVDLLAVFDSDDTLLEVHQGDTLSHTLGLAYNRHLDAQREVRVLFASCTLQEWDPTFIANVKRDGLVLFKRGPLPAPLAA